MHILIDIILIVFIAATGAAATLFYDFCIGEPGKGKPKSGRIFSRLGLFIHKRYSRLEGRKELKISEIDSKTDIERYNYSHVNLYKALGVCPICCNPYIAAITFVLSQLIMSTTYGHEVSWWFILPTVFISNTIFRLWWNRVL